MLMRIIDDKTLFSDLLQSVAYYSFIGGLFTVALPQIKANKVDPLPFTSLFFGLMFLNFIYTLAHVLRPIVQKYYPEFGLRGLGGYRFGNSPWQARALFAALVFASAIVAFQIVLLGVTA